MTAKRCLRGHDIGQVGRDSSGRCRRCKAEAMWAARAPRREAVARARAERAAAREAEERRAQEEAAARRQRDQEEAERRREAEYQAAIRRGGYDAAMARWDRASDETLIATGSRSGLCQWEDDDPEGRSMGRMCYRRTSDVYCGVHNRQLERESARERRKREAAEQMVDTRPPAPEPASQNAPPKPKAPRTRARRRARELESRWGQYKLDHPERARLYKSSAWTAARDRQLRDHPMCVVCGAKASVADHILNRARGGADLDPRNLQSMCRRCHHAKTVEESHCGRGAAERRKR